MVCIIPLFLSIIYYRITISALVKSHIKPKAMVKYLVSTWIISLIFGVVWAKQSNKTINCFCFPFGNDFFSIYVAVSLNIILVIFYCMCVSIYMHTIIKVLNYLKRRNKRITIHSRKVYKSVVNISMSALFHGTKIVSFIIFIIITNFYNNQTLIWMFHFLFT